jgi:hypothetical protein
VAGCVHQVEFIGLPVLGRVIQADGLRLDRDPALALDVHVVEHLRLHLTLGKPPVYWIRRSASVDLPWSIWAMMEKLRISARSVMLAR